MCKSATDNNEVVLMFHYLAVGSLECVDNVGWDAIVNIVSLDVKGMPFRRMKRI